MLHPSSRHHDAEGGSIALIHIKRFFYIRLMGGNTLILNSCGVGQAQPTAFAATNDQADDTIDLSGTPESTIGLAFAAEIQSTTWRVNSRREAPRLNTAHAALPKPA